jgi:RHS repeat-associated protein
MKFQLAKRTAVNQHGNLSSALMKSYCKPPTVTPTQPILRTSRVRRIAAAVVFFIALCLSTMKAETIHFYVYACNPSQSRSQAVSVTVIPSAGGGLANGTYSCYVGNISGSIANSTTYSFTYNNGTWSPQSTHVLQALAGVNPGGIGEVDVWYPYGQENKVYSRSITQGGQLGCCNCSPQAPVPFAGDIEGSVTINFGAPTPTPTPEPSPTSGPNTKCNDEKSGGNSEGCAGGCNAGMARYTVHSMLASLNITDTPLKYSPAYGPSIGFTLSYNQRDTQQPATFNYFNLGPKWTFNWLSYVSDDPSSQLLLTGLYRSGGGAEIFAYDGQSNSFVTDPQSHATLVKTSSTSYERRLPDGSKEVFATSDGAASYPRRIFLSEIYDSANNKVSLEYDTSLRIVKIKDAQLKETSVSYELAADPYKITKITDPFLRYAAFQYDSNGRLQTITDEIGIQSIFGYLGQSDFISSLTTPYGTTTFTKGESGTNRWIEAIDPEGGKERVEYRDNAPGIGSSESVVPNVAGLTNTGLDVRNTFYWSKKATQMYPPVSGVYDYTKAQITHWLLNPDGTVSGIVASKKQQLENRVWFTYAGQTDADHAGPSANPSGVARVLADNSTQLSQFESNSLGKTTRTTDPVGRVMRYTYDTNQIDLLEIRQQTGANNELLRKFTYNGLHEPLTDTDAAGQATTYSYNAQGQVLTRTNAKNETTTYAYGDGGAGHPLAYIRSITSPPFNGNSATSVFDYDSFNRLRVVTDSDGYAVTTDYDNLDRKTKVTYPDATYEEFRYTDNDTGVMKLDLTASRDRRGLWTYRKYDGNRHMISIKDPENRITLYGWCTCGALTSVTDPKNQTTTFYYDIQSRLHQKLFQDGTAISYLYEGQSAANNVGATSRLKSSTDARSQRTNYAYYPDDSLQQVSYTTTAGQALSPPTPSVSYTYDSNYKRVSTMMDGTGQTTYAYIPVSVPPVLGAAQLASVDGPLANDTIGFGYDELERATSRAINGAANSMTVGFDSLSRMNNEVNNLGTFGYSYVGVTNRLQTLSYPNGQAANFTYFPNSGDKQLQILQNLRPNLANLSRFDYVYDAEHMITQWTKQNDASTAQPLYFTYDGADQLASWKNNSVPPLHGGYIHTLAYDSAGNRQTDTYDEFPGGGWDPTETRKDETFNSVNQLTTAVGADPTPPPGPGPIEYDGGGDPPPPPPTDSYTYDLNGNLTETIYGRGGGNTLEWDAANRLTAINRTVDPGIHKRTELTYDGASHCKKIVEKSSGTVIGTKQFVWIGNRIAEQRDANNVVTRRYYSNGEQRIGGLDGGIYFYSKDHLGSIREMTDATGAVRTRYDYDPFGNTTMVSGDLSVDFGYTGHYWLNTIGNNLYLAPFRAYDPTIGRWISRDPIGERGGLNLYGYVANNPVNLIDPDGLTPPDYNPSAWNDPTTQYSNNCFSYACNRPGPRPGPTKPQPGAGTTVPLDPAKGGDCASVMASARASGLTDPDSSGKCPCNYHLVRLYTTDNYKNSKNPDYHWYRQDSNGLWSSKHGYLPVGPQIPDPDADARASGYDKTCGSMCAPD